MAAPNQRRKAVGPPRKPTPNAWTASANPIQPPIPTQPPEGQITPEPYNPSADGPAAKLWELLRRNNRFKQVAHRIVRLANAPLQAKPTEGSSAFTSQSDPVAHAAKHHRGFRRRLAADAAISRIGETNPFAETALRWLCPDPIFIMAIPQRFPDTDARGQPCKWDLIWEGAEPKPPPLTVPESEQTKNRPRLDGQPLHPGWEIQNGRVSHRGRLLRFGPHILKEEGDDPDPFQLWLEDQKNLPPFSTDSPWIKTPRLFRWHFQWRWRHIEHGSNQFTDRPDPRLSAFETGFFQDWHLRDFDRTTVEGLAHELQFERLSKCLVFAVPKLRYTASEIRDFMKQFGDRLNKALVSHEAVLGKRNEWKVLLAVEKAKARDGAGFSLDLALQEAGEDLYGFGKYNFNSHGTHIGNYYRTMNAPEAGSGWIQRVFPSLPPELFASP